MVVVLSTQSVKQRNGGGGKHTICQTNGWWLWFLAHNPSYKGMVVVVVVVDLSTQSVTQGARMLVKVLSTQSVTQGDGGVERTICHKKGWW